MKPRSKIQFAHIKLIFSLLRQRPFLLTFGVISLALGSAVNLILPQLLRGYIEPGKFGVFFDHPSTVTYTLVGLFALQGVTFFFRSVCFTTLGILTAAEMRRRLFSELHKKEINFFDSRKTADIVTRLINDLALVQDAVGTKLSVVLRYGIQALIGGVLMVVVSLHLTLLSLAAIAGLVLLSLPFIQRLRKASGRTQQEISAATILASEYVSGLRSVRVLNAERKVQIKFNDQIQRIEKASRHRASISAFFSSFIGFILNSSLLLICVYGAYLVRLGEIPLDVFAAFCLYGIIVGVSFMFLIGGIADFTEAIGALDRVTEISDLRIPGYAKGNSTEHPDGTKAQIEGLTLKVENLNFGYSDNEPIVKDVSFETSRGTTLGMVGPSGTGKSTLIALLLGLYPEYLGRIVMDGRALPSIPKEELWSLISWVPQEPMFFSWSIRENLSLASLSEAEMLEACRAASCDEFISELPDGLDTIMGERGVRFSSGQRQRIAIARAILRRPRLLILDEATAALDSKTEAKVFDGIRRYLPGVTMIVVSHRLATVTEADRILVMSAGTIAEAGTHESLENLGGIYANFAQHQRI